MAKDITLTADEVITMVGELQHVVDALESTEEYHMVLIVDAVMNLLLSRLLGGE